ncbi:hypothetical protein AB0N65_03665 [Paenarthrobacter sp. NPDC089322]|uniref:hypothetical protein n=1 Tax=Paenarthrobacter sp. NPDC089322 TaxID=3155065 RepID=UPI003418C87C
MSSQEQRPIRSRRELRRAREEQQQAAQATVAVDAAAATAPPAGQKVAAAQGSEAQGPDAQGSARNRRAADAPVDALGSAAQERSSQIRARDRAALRTIKELADKEEQLSGGGPPTRRQLRLQQLQAEVATSANPIIPAPGAKLQPSTSSPSSPAGSPDSSGSGEAPPVKATTQGEKQPAANGQEMSVEQALAVRELIAAQVQNQTAKLEHIAEQDPLAVDPEVLAQQIALAERAAVLNKRAAAKQKLAEQNQAEQHQAGNAKTPAAAGGPSTANNLAMVTPLEFVKVPGIERPVMKRPSTTFVPVVTSSGPKLETSSPAAPGKGARGRAGVLARAEALARNARKRPVTADQPVEEAQRPPVSASTAYGLDPLDASTAGLARAQRNRLLQYGVLALGIVALIVGIIMITSG